MRGGTAPMGVDGDPRAVVDPRCRVRGIDNLWVIDGPVPDHHDGGVRAAEFVR
ncbi:hypothetical protein MAHJHV33_50250 [Mycobacterium avium subsp. hominissuis]